MRRDRVGRDEATINDIVESCRLIQEFIEGFDYTMFAEDTKTQSSVIHRLLTVGEAAKRLSTETRGRTFQKSRGKKSRECATG